MSKWLIAIILGVAVLGGVYYLRENVVTTPVGTADPSVPAQPAQVDPSSADAPASPADDSVETGEEDTRIVLPDDALTGPTIPPGTASSLIAIDFPWARASIGDKNITAVYMLLTNTGNADAVLQGATSPDAARVEIHQTTLTGSVASMKKIDHLVLEPGVPTALEQGGLHLMVMGLKRTLSDGDVIDLTLDFGPAGTVPVKVPVGEPDDTDTNPVP